jgi:hypothetical protein
MEPARSAFERRSPNSVRPSQRRLSADTAGPWVPARRAVPPSARHDCARQTAAKNNAATSHRFPGCSTRRSRHRRTLSRSRSRCEKGEGGSTSRNRLPTSPVGSSTKCKLGIRTTRIDRLRSQHSHSGDMLVIELTQKPLCDRITSTQPALDDRSSVRLGPHNPHLIENKTEPHKPNRSQSRSPRDRHPTAPCSGRVFAIGFGETPVIPRFDRRVAECR